MELRLTLVQQNQNLLESRFRTISQFEMFCLR